MRNYFQIIAIGCHHTGNQVPELPVCSGGENLPSLPVMQGMLPDQQTGEFKEIPFKAPEITKKTLKNFVTNNMPSYAEKIDDNKEFKVFDKKNQDLNTFYLFSEKK